jgi:hypothetical protein
MIEKTRGAPMPRKFRLTCARTTYFDIDIAADSSAEAERLLESMLKIDPMVAERQPIGRPVDRVVEIGAEEQVAAKRHDAAA